MFCQLKIRNRKKKEFIVLFDVWQRGTWQGWIILRKHSPPLSVHYPTYSGIIRHIPALSHIILILGVASSGWQIYTFIGSRHVNPDHVSTRQTPPTIQPWEHIRNHVSAKYATNQQDVMLCIFIKEKKNVICFLLGAADLFLFYGEHKHRRSMTKSGLLFDLMNLSML